MPRSTKPGCVASAAVDEFMTVAEIARTLKLNQQTVRNWIDRGDLPAVHVGRRVRVKRSDFDRLIDQGYQRGEPIPAEAPAETIWDGNIAPPEIPLADERG